MNKEYFVLIDTNKDTTQLIGAVKKNDVNVDIIMTLVQNGEIYDLSDASYITVTIQKPDGTTNNGYAEVLDPVNGKVKYTLPINVTNQVGQYVGEMQVYIDALSFSTAAIGYVVKDSLLNDEGVTAQDSYPILTQLINENNEIQTVEAARVIAETERESAESARANTFTTNETTRQNEFDTNEASRATAEASRVTAESSREGTFTSWEEAWAAMVASIGTTPEVFEARTSDIKSQIFDTLKDRLESSEIDIATLLKLIEEIDQPPIQLSTASPTASVITKNGAVPSVSVEGGIVQNLAKELKDDSFLDQTTRYLFGMGKAGTNGDVIVRFQSNKKVSFDLHNMSDGSYAATVTNIVDGSIINIPQDQYIRYIIGHTNDGWSVAEFKSAMKEGAFIVSRDTNIPSGLKVIGTQSTQNVALLTKQKNLFNKNDVINGYYINLDGNPYASAGNNVSELIEIEPNTEYVISASTAHIERYATYDINRNFVARAAYNVEAEKTLTSETNAFFIRLQYNDGADVDTIQLETGAVATDYEEPEVNLGIVQYDAIKLRNGAGNTLEIKNGKAILTMHAEPHVFVEDDIIQIIDVGYSEVDAFVTRAFPDAIEFPTAADGSSMMQGFTETANANINNVANEWKYASRAAKDFIIVVPNGTYPDLASAKAGLAGKTVWYQREEPKIVEIPIHGEPPVFGLGKNHITLMTGLAYEKANPVHESTYYFINIDTNLYPSIAGSEFNYKAKRILKIEKVINSEKIDDTHNWVFSSSEAYGEVRARIHEDLYDITSERFYVTYEILPEENNAGVFTAEIKYTDNLIKIAEQTAQMASNNADKIGQLQTEVAPLVKPLEWIEPTLLNGWVNNSLELKYCKDPYGFVHIEGDIKDGVVSNGTKVCEFVKGYRPKGAVPINAVRSNDASYASFQMSSAGELIIFGATSVGTFRINGTFKAGE